MRIYLDNNATTAIHPQVLQVLDEALREVFGNASSIHKEGQTARRVIEDARESVARLIGAVPREVVFTSGGTESNNAAIFGALAAGGRHHIVTTGVEHPSVAEAVAELERRGHEVTRVPPARSGEVAAQAVLDALRPHTRLVAMMLANNETGVIQPVEEVGRVCRQRGIHFHCDAVQAVGKIDVSVHAIQCDTLAVSAHKLHAPKGIGALYVRGGLSLAPFVFGGAQERRRRAGTENVPLAAAFGAAAAIAAGDSWRDGVAALRDALEAAMKSAFEVTVNGEGVRRLPNTSNLTVHGADGEGLVIALDLSGVAVSTGSACSSGRVEPSPILLAMGLSPAEARSTVRFSLSRFTSAAEIDRTVALLNDVVPRTLTVNRFNG
ncbi:MAG TPA: cysteine desulfurase family protein [Thermoanaerobaculia bacterium]|nr:cysteine desulfurase family protein [Thermoanaerobaculia bacterium]